MSKTRSELFDYDIDEMVFYGYRYACGRMSYTNASAALFVKKYAHKLSNNSLFCISKELRDHPPKNDSGLWQKALIEVNAVIEKRKKENEWFKP